MSRFYNNVTLHLLLGVLVILVGVQVMLPYYGYYLDADAVAYESILRRYATGDWDRAVNGMWSPLQVWILTPFYTPENALHNHHVAVIANSIIGALTLISVVRLAARVGLSIWAQIGLLWIWVVAMLYFIYLQVYGDLLGTLLLLWVILLVLLPRKSYYHWALIGVLGALSYMAKSYNFYYFPLLIVVLMSTDVSVSRAKRWAHSVYTLVCYILVCAPWLMVLHEKYGMWTSSVSGRLNLSWELMHRKDFSADILALVPPSYADSPCFWEDPYFSHGTLYSATDSLHLLLMKIATTIYNVYFLILELGLISPLVVVAYILALYCLMRYLRSTAERSMQVLSLAMLLLPLGYIGTHVESRYVWLGGFLGSIVLFYFLYKKSKLTLKPAQHVILYALIALSFWAYPVVHLEELFNKGKYEYETAMQLRDLGLRNRKFISNVQGDISWKLAYWTENQFYDQKSDTLSVTSIAQDMVDYEIRDMVRWGEGGPAIFGSGVSAELPGDWVQLWSDGRLSWYHRE